MLAATIRAKKENSTANRADNAITASRCAGPRRDIAQAKKKKKKKRKEKEKEKKTKKEKAGLSIRRRRASAGGIAVRLKKHRVLYAG